MDMDVFNVLSYTNWFHNLKAAVKRSAPEKAAPISFMKEHRFLKKSCSALSGKGIIRPLPDNMQAAAEEAVETLLHSGDGQLCDVIIDRATLEAIKEAGRQSQDDIIRDYAESTVAVANIKIAVRSSKTAKSLDFMKRAMAPCDSLNVDGLARAALAGMDSIIDYLSANGYLEGAPGAEGISFGFLSGGATTGLFRQSNRRRPIRFPLALWWLM